MTAVSARDRSRDRGISLDGVAWFDDPVALAKSDDIDVFVELIGGQEGIALDSVRVLISAYTSKHLETRFFRVTILVGFVSIGIINAIRANEAFNPVHIIGDGSACRRRDRLKKVLQRYCYNLVYLL